MARGPLWYYRRVGFNAQFLGPALGRLESFGARRPATAAGIFFAGLTALFFYPTFGRDFIFRDSYHEFYPMMLMWGWSGGLPPLWNPYVNLGAPLVGSVVQGAFYPVQVLLLGVLRLSPSLTMNLFIYSHYWLAAMGMWALLRVVGGRAAGPVAGAVGYAFGGYLVGMNYARNLLPGFGLVPLALALFVHARRESRPSLAAAAGMGLGLVMLGGDPQAFAVTFVAGPAVALLLVPGRQARGASALRAGSVPVVFWMVALLTAAAELLPALANFARLGRSSGFGEQAMSWSFHPARIIEFFSAGFFGSAWPFNAYWGGFTAGSGFALPMALSCYLGAWTIAAAAAMIASRPLARPTLVFGAGAVIALLLALGGHTPLYPFLLAHVPSFGIFRYPEKYLFWFVLCAAVLAGLGTDAVLEDPRSRRAAFRAALGVGILLALAAAIAWAARLKLIAMLAPMLTEPVGPNASAAVGMIISALARSGATFGLGAAVVWVAAQDRRLWIVPALFLFSDLFSTGRPLLMAEPGFYRAPSRFAAVIAEQEKSPSLDGPCRFAEGRPCLDPGRFRLFRDNSISPPLDTVSYFNGIMAVNQVRLRRWERDTLKPNLAVMDGIEDFAGMNVASSAAFNVRMGELTLDQLPRHNVKYAVIPTEAEQKDAGYRVIDRLGGASLVELDQVWPRAYLVPIEALSVRPEESSPSAPPAEARWATMPTAPPLAAKIITYTPDRVTVEVNGPAPGWLVLNDAYSPGWRCSAGPIVRLDKLVRAVLVPAGPTRVEFVYHPPLFGAGLAATFLGLALGVFGIFLARSPLENQRLAPGPSADSASTSAPKILKR